MDEQLSQVVDLYVTLEDMALKRSFDEALASVDLDAFARRALLEAGVHQPVMFTLMVTDDATIQEMNNQYRQQNKPTDVLSFPLLDQPLVEAPAELLWQPPEQPADLAPEAAAPTPPPFVTPPGQPTNLGDIAISWPTVLRQAAAAGHSPRQEFLYLLAHGILHLVGYDDQTQAGYETMVRKQEAILAATGERVGGL
ncbi:rRNA maturation RNase YbeY [Thermogemmatispora carboxidivorans]|uniref:rRNA maturation RNase YbeY n=1 Tax=Thermogemmatispora carboxidivorans TaxID=1382306 RepID=UPI00069C2DCF|nr:rRNA maturation RNase YbeY [Thermogemmatispora carboxidivorans]